MQRRLRQEKGWHAEVDLWDVRHEGPNQGIAMKAWRVLWAGPAYLLIGLLWLVLLIGRRTQ